MNIEKVKEIEKIYSKRENVFIEIFENLSVDDKYDLAKNTSSEHLLGFLMMEVEFNNNIEISRGISSNLHCSEHMFETLSNLDDIEVKKAVVSNINCPERILKELSSFDNIEVKRAIALNSNCSSEILDEFAKIDDIQLKNNIIDNSNCLTRTLETLVNDKNKDISEKASKNPRYCTEYTTEHLEELVNSEYDFNRAEVAKMKDCPKYLLKQLAVNDKSLYVKKAIVENSNCPEDILKIFYTSKNEEIRNLAFNNPNCTEDSLRKYAFNSNYWVRESVVSNLKCPVDILEKLSTDSNPVIRQAISRNPNTSAELLMDIYKKDWRHDCMYSMLENPNCPVDILKKFTNSFTKEVLKNPNCPSDVIDEMYKNLESFETDKLVLFVQNKNTPENVLEDISDKLIKAYINLEEEKISLLDKRIRKDCIEDVFEEFFCKENTSPEILDNIYDSGFNSFEISFYRDSYKNFNGSFELLDKIVSDKKVLVFGDIKDSFFEMKKKLEELGQTTFVEHYDIDAFKKIPFKEAKNELEETLKKAEKDGLVFEPLNKEKESQSEIDKPDVGDKNSTDDGIDL